MKKIILSSVPYPKFNISINSLMGSIFVFQGIYSIMKKTNYVFGIFQLLFGIIVLFYTLIQFLKYLYPYFIMIDEDSISFKNNWYQKSITINKSEILDLEISEKLMKIKTKQKVFNLNFRMLDYHTKTQILPEFLEEVKKIKESILNK